ncbi:unnamed protein product [Candidatus Paraburkholderia kirkii UZHbot1]|uniref:WGS project CAFE00000000 data, contig bkir_c103 n=1 Tax=Candidatus Paraburkholderia kirkii UZHbot1 TaxID=1055526 RepID=U3UAF9_9BURK|nr:unnamed protein product [Candidatus Paraburkholderia kirkii UZHbot1]
MTHAASAVTARGLALAGAAPANFLRHNPKSADSKAWFATEAPSANAAGPPRFHHLPPACLALAGATCHSHSKLAQSHRRPSCHSNHYDGKTFALCIREFKTGCADGYRFDVPAWPSSCRTATCRPPKARMPVVHGSITLRARALFVAGVADAGAGVAVADAPQFTLCVDAPR